MRYNAWSLQPHISDSLQVRGRCSTEGRTTPASSAAAALAGAANPWCSEWPTLLDTAVEIHLRRKSLTK